MTTAKKPAAGLYRVAKPHSWKKAVKAAGLRMVGLTQKDTAIHAGISERSLSAYESSDWWPKACEEARGFWLSGVQVAAMQGIARALKDPNEYAKMSRWLAERLMPELAPPKQTQEHTGKDGGPILLGRADLDQVREEIAARLVAGPRSEDDPENSEES